ncbi:MAG: uracil-DNA glycosylase [Pseudomonadota bacterium]
MQHFSDFFDIGVKYHSFTFEESNDHEILQKLQHKLKHQSVDLPERDVALGAFKPFIPVNFHPQEVKAIAPLKPQKRADVKAPAQKLNRTERSNLLKDISSAQKENIIKPIKVDLDKALDDKILEAASLAKEAKSLSDLLEGVRQFETGTELQRLAGQPIFYTGEEKIDILVIGDSPTREDEQNVRPFSGVAGNIMRDAFRYCFDSKTEHSQIGYANLIFWRPLTRNLSPGHYKMCLPFLRRLITLLQPKKIILAGALPAQYLLETPATLMTLRGKTQNFTLDGLEFQAFVTFHPNYLLRVPIAKKYFWFDMLRFFSQD